MSHTLNIQTVPGQYAISRLAPDADFPGWLNGPGFSAAIRASDEVTLVCPEDRVPAEVEADRDWICLRSIGPFPFEAAGIVQSFIAPLSDKGIGVFVVCTFDGEHVLVPGAQAAAALRAAGHRVTTPG
ncbi:hypothetical protein TRM7557_00258 [Tritonibacter multivorans]|uniref:Uncharacterized protein n=1 Tax=Tritonibacter multivorans TaxID=928856 RepID=A0A0P1G0F4_9RHOB|nr:ACT domain-containing protein [Tritonibacter multivorans]MDA7419300.1 ACT domain-containing protein [Tritonibacter multivorans]CUH75184.1 hypothetical protein TRM7557_00258 [Tritonibacter multivorans]SFD23122.1 hypothetical protein SAMN04488049_109104 [Tritonibacter multivorans]